jgi:hypothetical protein
MTKVKPSKLLRNFRALARSVECSPWLGPTAEQKNEFHRLGKSVLRAVLAELGVDGDVRSCLGGPAVMGEVILHTDRVYVCLCTSSGGADARFYYRTCRGRNDYAGGPNLWYTYRSLSDNPTGFVDGLRALTSPAHPQGARS